MIERTFNIEGAEIEVTFQWDSGDPSVGIGAGWGEDTGVVIKAGPIRTCIIFEVEEESSPESWKIHEVQVLDKTGAVSTEAFGIRGRSQSLRIFHTLGELPTIVEAVTQTWQQLCDIRALEAIGDEGWGILSYADELEWKLSPDSDHTLTDQERHETEAKLVELRKEAEEVKAKADRMQAEYSEKYQNANTK